MINVLRTRYDSTSNPESDFGSKKSDDVSPLAKALIALVVVGLFLVFLVASIRGAMLCWHVATISQWEKTEAVVEAFTPAEESKSHRMKNRRVYCLTIRYRFEVDGKSYVGHRYGFDSNDNDNLIKKFDVGERVDVFYDPNAPEYCAMIRDGSTFGFFAVPVCLLITCMFGYRSVQAVKSLLGVD